MPEEFWTISDVVKCFQVEEHFIKTLEDEEIICSSCLETSSKKVFTAIEVEKVRLAKTLVEDMGVNLAGVEVVLRMRQNMIDMRRQFDDILEDLAKQLDDSFKTTAR